MQRKIEKNKVKIRGISVCNPVDLDKDYLLFTVEYAGKLGFNHMQVIGPIHNGIKGNIDGMTPYRKYSRFNEEKEQSYIKYSIEAVNEACARAKEYGMRMYQWHHELDLPAEFKEAFPETVNSYGDVEVTHPIVKDFLENKIIDFFYTYPGMDGIILTLHETKIPLLKLKDQKLGKIERVKYVTEILYNTCQALGKELIVRPFASIEEDYIMMTKAYEEISEELLIMDKWTQFDWSLTMPNNAFFLKIEKNPLLVEADIFGEFFGKGHIPLMLKDHIAKKIAYCEAFLPEGYVARIDREGQIPFGSVNEVNLVIMNAYLSGKEIEKEIEQFFREKYLDAWNDIKALMEQTEEVLKKIIYTKGYYFTELSRFPSLNHSKNHFYFEMMRDQYDIASEEWFIPKNWERGSLEELLAEKDAAVYEAGELYQKLVCLKDKINPQEYQGLWKKFTNLKLIAEIWRTLTATFMAYVEAVERPGTATEAAFEEAVDMFSALKKEGVELLGDAFYCLNGGAEVYDYMEDFVQEIKESYYIEKEMHRYFKTDDKVIDYVVCGGAMEGHRLKKEVNFSDTLIVDGALCRIPGNQKGMEWSSINAHGWFSYELHVKSKVENVIKIQMGSTGERLEAKITIGTEEYLLQDEVQDKKELIVMYTPEGDNSTVRIQFNKISSYTPLVYSIAVYENDLGEHEERL